MTIQTVPLAALKPNSANPRRAIDDDALHGLAQSIQADGLLQNLVVRKKGRKYEIISGERRYQALLSLQKEGAIQKDHPVPVEIRARLSNTDALRIATVENVQREQLAPMDEAEAFANLLADGATLEDVAAKAGVSIATVKRRLALSSLSDDAKSLVREGTIPLSTAEALTIGTQEQQAAIIGELKEGRRHNADTIRDRLIGHRPAKADAIFPLERYTGTYTSDLFADDDSTYFDDADSFFALQREAVDTLVNAYEENSAFVDLHTDHYVAWWQYEDAEDGEAAGVVIHFDPSGEVEIHENQARRPLASAVIRDTADSPSEPKSRPEYSKPVIRLANAEKTVAVMASLLQNRRIATEVSVITLLRQYDHAHRITLNHHPALQFISYREDEPPTAYTKIEDEARDYLSRLIDLAPDERDANDAPAAWARLLLERHHTVRITEAIKTLTDDELLQLQIVLTTLCFGPAELDEPDGDNSLFNRVAGDLEISMRDHWTPNEAFLTLRTKAQLIDIASDSGATDQLGRVDSFKKKDLVLALSRFFRKCANDDPSIPDETRAKANEWTPSIMAFPFQKDAAIQADQDTDCHADPDETAKRATPPISSEAQAEAKAA